MEKKPANDNCLYRQVLYRGHEYLWEHFNHAQYLIKTYCNKYWAHDKYCFDYLILEQDIVLSLHSLSCASYQSSIVISMQALADTLNVTPLTLYNDQNVPLLNVNRDIDIFKYPVSNYFLQEQS